jgi:hypothetical protein
LQKIAEEGKVASFEPKALKANRKQKGTFNETTIVICLNQSTARLTSSGQVRALKIVPFQEVKKGVYIQQVEIKTFKVSQDKPHCYFPSSTNFTGRPNIEAENHLQNGCKKKPG